MIPFRLLRPLLLTAIGNHPMHALLTDFQVFHDDP